MNCFPQWVKNEYGKEWECYCEFLMQYIENHDSVKVQMSHLKPETEHEGADKWNVLSLLKTEAEVSDYLAVTMRLCVFSQHINVF